MTTEIIMLNQAAGMPAIDAGNALNTFLSKDGQKVTQRLIQPSDAKLLVDFFYKLSPHTVKMRFHGHVSFPPLKQVWKLAKLLSHINNRQHLAIVASVQKSIGERIIGVARYAETYPGNKTVDVAIVIRDDMQHQGIGSVLFRELMSKAKEHGYEKIQCRVLAENTLFLHFLDTQGFDMQRYMEDGCYVFIINLTQGKAAA